MNLKHYFMRLFAWSVVVTLGLLALSCSDDETSDAPHTLYYADVVNIAPDMDFDMAQGPSYHGVAPSNYRIERITLDGNLFQGEQFVINQETGAVGYHPVEGVETPLGLYSLSIACTVNGHEKVYADVLTFKMVATLPMTLLPDQAQVAVSLEDILQGEKQLPEVKLSVDSLLPSITIERFEFPEASQTVPYYAYFSISKDGVISINRKADVKPGHFVLDVAVVTTAKRTGIYEKLVTFDFQSKPLGVKYDEGVLVETGRKMEMNAPQVTGSLDGLQFSIAKVKPLNGASETSDFKINAETGVVYTEEGNTLTVGAAYDLDIKVKNNFGEAIFENAVHLEVVAFVAPIENFAYTAQTKIHYLGFEVEKDAEFVGDNVTFSLKELPEALQGKITVDAATGKLSTPQVQSPINLDNVSFEIPIGQYNVTVEAENMKGKAEATLALTIEESKAYFTQIRYGNNLGLPETEADQFRYTYVQKSGEDAQNIAAPKTDIEAGVKTAYSLITPERFKFPFKSIEIDAATGALSFVNDCECINVTSAVIVKVTVGEGAESFYRQWPVFFSVTNQDNIFDYTPFVLRVAPSKGGRSVQPEAMSGINLSTTLFDYRRNGAFCNLWGDASDFVSGGMKDTNSYMQIVWRKYGSTNYGAKDPMSYYKNEANLVKALLYVDNSADAANHCTLVVNPNKWTSENGATPASGILNFQCTCVTDGDAGKVNNGKQIWPICVWFDETL